MYSFDGIEDLLRRRPAVGPSLQLMRKDIQQYFRVGVRIEMPPVFAGEQPGEFIIVGQITVVSQADTVGRIDVKRLRFR